MRKKRNIEIFSAGCSLCEQTIREIKKLACESCEVRVLDMRQKNVATKAKKYGVRSLPAVVIDGKLADCCAGRGVELVTLQAAGLGLPLAR
jgi:hypothetical protein